jgi:hypothetical protein
LYNGTAGSKYMEYNPGSELNFFSLEQQTMKSKESNETKVKQIMMKS